MSQTLTRVTNVLHAKGCANLFHPRVETRKKPPFLVLFLTPHSRRWRSLLRPRMVVFLTGHFTHRSVGAHANESCAWVDNQHCGGGGGSADDWQEVSEKSLKL